MLKLVKENLNAEVHGHVKISQIGYSNLLQL